MRLISKAAFALGLLASLTANAVNQTLSQCETITAVVNETSATTSQLYLVLSPPINIAHGAPANCSSNGVAGTLGFLVGSGGVSASNINSFLASSLSAYNAGHKVMIYYDYTNTSSCVGIDFADGGWNAQC